MDLLGGQDLQETRATGEILALRGAMDLPVELDLREWMEIRETPVQRDAMDQLA